MLPDRQPPPPVVSPIFYYFLEEEKEEEEDFSAVVCLLLFVPKSFRLSQIRLGKHGHTKATDVCESKDIHQSYTISSSLKKEKKRRPFCSAVGRRLAGEL
jgi:hypothetical protein